jgi:hypothetical protein
MKKQILFLDDDRYEMQGYIDKLGAENFEVIQCASVPEAFEVLKA